MEKSGPGAVSLARFPCTRVLAAVLCAFVPLSAFAQGSAGSEGKLEPRYLVDVPTAGMMHKSGLAVDVDFYQGGGVLLGLSVGVFERLTLGISYGGSRLIGTDSPVMNAIPGFIVKVRFLEESIALPAFVLGFDSQGRDGYIASLSRYSIKSPGFFIAASRNYTLLGFFSMHAGVNYSLERADGDRDLNYFFGLEKTLGPTISLVAEFNLGVNDNNANAIGRGRGYFNAGLRWSLGSGLTLAVNFKDIIQNAGAVTVANRTARLEYVKAL